MNSSHAFNNHIESSIDYQVSSPGSPHIISDSEESTWTQDDEEANIFSSGAGGFYHSIHVGGRNSAPCLIQTPKTTVAVQIKALANQKDETLEQTHVLSSDDDTDDDNRSRSDSSYYSDKVDGESSSSSENMYDGHEAKTQRIPQLIFSPAEETLIGTEVIFRKADCFSQTYSSSIAAIHIPHLLSSGSRSHKDDKLGYPDVHSPPTKRSIAQKDFSPCIVTSSLEYSVDNDKNKCSPSQNKPLDLSLCAIDDVELGTSLPKLTLVPTMTVLSSNINHHVPTVVYMNETSTDVIPKRYCLSSLFTQLHNTHFVSASPQTFTFPPSIWYLERKRQRRERFYIGVIVSSIIVLLALGVIILIQQFY